MTEFLPWIALALALFPVGFAIDNLRRMAKARGPAPKRPGLPAASSNTRRSAFSFRSSKTFFEADR
jgi:hypothetical protein